MRNLAKLPAHLRFLVMLQSSLNMGAAILTAFVVLFFNFGVVYWMEGPSSDFTSLIVWGMPAAFIVMILYASHCLLVQKHYVFCVVCAAIESLTIIGTIPGGVMLFLLFSPRIKDLFNLNLQNEE